MSAPTRIPIPLAQRWRRFRYTVLPLVSFAGCVGLALVLWQRQASMPNALGEVEVVRLDVAASADGVLVPLESGPWALFDAVQRGQVVARLDDRPVRATIRTLRLDVTRLQKELDATETQMAWNQADRRFDDAREAARLAWEVERRRLDALDRKATIEADRVALQLQNRRIDYLRALADKKALSQMELDEANLLRDQIAKRIEQAQAALKESETQVGLAEGRLKAFTPQKIEVTKLLAPLQAQIAVQESAVSELDLQVESLEIRSPIGGTISQIYCWPGQHVRRGDAILSVASNTGRYVVSYLRQEQRVRPNVNAPVDLRLRMPNSPTIASRIERVGPQFELIPEHHRRDPKILEWGLPIRIALPEGLLVRPGELIDVTFGTWEDGKSG